MKGGEVGMVCVQKQEDMRPESDKLARAQVGRYIKQHGAAKGNNNADIIKHIPM